MRIWWWEMKTNEEVRRLAGMPMLEEIIRTRRLQWLGHVIRMEEGRMARQLLDGKLKGAKRPFSGVRRRWVDVIRKDAEAIGVKPVEIPEVANDRARWRATIKRKDQDTAALAPPRR